MAKPQIFNRDMKRLAYLDNALAVGYGLETNSLWTATFTLPADDPKNAYCTPLNFVEIFDGDERIDLFRIIGEDMERSNGATRYTKTDNKEDFDMDINEARKQLTSCADTGDTPSAWAKEAAEYCKRKGIFNGDGAGNFGWQQPITREAVACIIYRALEAAGALGNLSDV